MSLGRLSVEPQRVCLAVMVLSVASPATACVPPGPALSPTGVRSERNQGPCNGPSCAGVPDGDKAIPGGTKAVAGEATDRTITARHTLCGSTESRTKAKTAGTKTKRLDLGGNVEAHRRESLHAPGPAVREGGQEADGKSGASEFGNKLTEEGRRGGGGGGGSDEGGPASYPRGVVPPSGVV